METEEKKYPNEKKLKSPNNYNILKWELKIFDTCIMAITCTSGFGATNAEMLHVGGPEARC